MIVSTYCYINFIFIARCITATYSNINTIHLIVFNNTISYVFNNIHSDILMTFDLRNSLYRKVDLFIQYGSSFYFIGIVEKVSPRLSPIASETCSNK